MTSTIKLSEKLQAMGFEKPQSDGLAELFIEIPELNLATKVDLAEVKGEVTVLRGDMMTQFAKLEGRINMHFWILSLFGGVIVSLLLLLLRK